MASRVGFVVRRKENGFTDSTVYVHHIDNLEMS